MESVFVVYVKPKSLTNYEASRDGVTMTFACRAPDQATAITMATDEWRRVFAHRTAKAKTRLLSTSTSSGSAPYGFPIPVVHNRGVFVVRGDLCMDVVCGACVHR